MYSLTAAEQVKAKGYLNLRFRDASRYEDALSMAYLELDYVTVESLTENNEFFVDLYNRDEFVPESILKACKSEDAIPVRVDIFNKEILAIYACNEEPHFEYDGYTVRMEKVPSFIFFKNYLRVKDTHRDLLSIPARTLLDTIFAEGISLKAADITISTDMNLGRVYYNVAKKYVKSNIIFSKNDVVDIIKILCINSPYDFAKRMPKDIGVTINEDYRGRVNICPKIGGFVITVRLLPNAYFDKSFESLNLKPKTIDFIKKYILSEDFGLRLVVGATMSGKNTTVLACLNEVIHSRLRKIVSVEMPVEQYLPGLEQIDCKTSEEYNMAVNALLRQNPDYVYITEMSENTANSAIRISNTGKVMLSTLHANSCADVISRLQDITGLSTDKIIQATHCILYQELVRDEEKDCVYPRNTMLYLDHERKSRLYGLPYGECLKLLETWEEKDV